MRDMWGAARGVTIACARSRTSTVYFVSPVQPACGCRGRIAIIDCCCCWRLVAGTRLLARTVIERPGAGLVARGKEVLVVGAGDAGQLVIREMQRSRQLGYTPIGLIDDDPRKKNLRIHGVRVLGTTDDLPHILRDNKPDEVLIAIPSASGEARQRIVTATREGNVPVKTLPGLYELISGESELATQIRPVQVEDVLGREPVEVDLEATAAYVRDQTVLVTGAGGSIGSELCRQIARLGPQRLVLVDQGETALFEIERELVDERGFAGVRARARPTARAATKMQPGLRALPAGGRLPRGRLQARAADGGQPARVGAQQRARDARSSPRPRSSSARSGSCSSRPTRRSTRRR